MLLTNAVLDWLAEDAIERTLDALRHYVRTYPAEGRKELVAISRMHRRLTHGTSTPAALEQLENEVRLRLFMLIDELKPHLEGLEVRGARPSPERRTDGAVFIAYCYADLEFSRTLERKLHGRGVRVFREERELKEGTAMDASLIEAMRWAPAVLLCASQAALDSPWVQAELEVLSGLERPDEASRLVLLAIDGSLSEGWSEVVERLDGADIIDVRRWGRDPEGWATPLEQLMTALGRA